MAIPCKTAAGHAELAIRQRGLSQRHRTLLFLVDGRRTLQEVIELGLQAGVPKGYIDELLALGLVVMGAPVQTLPVDLSSPPPLGRGPGGSAIPASAIPASAIPLGRLARDGRSEDDADDSSADSAFVDEQADTRFTGLPLSNTELAALDEGDTAFAQARGLLMRVLRDHGVVTTAVTLLRVRRARDRATLQALVPDIRLRLSRAGASPQALQAVDQADALLGT